MALTTIQLSKEFEENYQPLLLVEIVWPERFFGVELVERLCARSLDPLETGIVGINFEGNTYAGRILNHQFAAWQVLSSNGVGMSPSLDLEIADPDLDLWDTYEGDGGPGFRGARIRVTFVFADFTKSPPEFSTNKLVVFTGKINQPRSTDTVLRLNATSMLLMQYATLPSTHLQKRCPWIHPETETERANAEDYDSPFFPCGAFDLNGGIDNGVAQDGQANACNHTLSDCVRLGRFKRGTTGVGRFGGSVYALSIPKQWVGFEPHNTRVFGFNADTSEKYAQVVPMVLGFGWVDCVVTSVYGEAGYTRYEAVFCEGDTNGVSVPLKGYLPLSADATAWVVAYGDKAGWILTCGGRTLGRQKPGATRAPQLPETPFVGDPLNGYWVWISQGQRNGTCCRELGFVDNPDLPIASRTPLGDPYGSISAVYVSILKEAAQSETLAQIRLLGGGPMLPHGDNKIVDPATGKAMPGVVTPWALHYALTRGGWLDEELDLDSFQAAADKSSVYIGYTDAQGNRHEAADGHPLWKTNLVLQQPTALATIVEGLLNNCDGMLVQGGKLCLVLRETLASQQGDLTKVPWTNDRAPYPSMLVDGTPAAGYYAYVFDESNIKQLDNEESSLTIDEPAFEESPNALSFSFADEENQYRNDSLTVIDERDMQRTGMLIPAGAPMAGIPNFDQGFRASWRRLAQQSRGNPRYEDHRQIGTSGTWIARFATTVKMLGLQAGDIIGLRSKRYNLGQGLKPQDFRVVKIEATPDFAEFVITAWWHDDLWHLQTFGQQDEDLLTNPGAEHVNRIPFTWQPYMVKAADGDPLMPGAYSFGLRQVYQPNSDGSIEARLEISGYPPMNDPAPPSTLVPHVSSEPYAVSGGALTPGAIYYVGIAARETHTDPTTESAIQEPPFAVKIPEDGTRRTIYVPKISYHGGSGHALYLGTDTSTMSGQSSSDITQPASFTLADYKRGQWAPVDVGASRFRVLTKHVWHSGVWGQPIDAVVSPSEISVLESDWSPDQWAGRVVSVLGRAAEPEDGEPLPIWNAKVLSNTADTLTLDQPLPGVLENDALVMRAKATAVTADSVTDSQWVNTLSEPVVISDAWADPGDGHIVCRAYIHNFKDGDAVRIFGADTLGTIDNAHEMNGPWTISVVDENTFGLNGSTLATAYEPRSGMAQIQGMRPAEEVGRMLYVIAGVGAGQARRVIANDATTLTVETPFDPPLSAGANASIFIVEEATWIDAGPTDILMNRVSPADEAHRQPVKLTAAVPNRSGQMMRVMAQVENQAGRHSPSAPWREIWVWGKGNFANESASTYVDYDTATWNVNNTTVTVDACPHVVIKRPGSPFELTAEAKYTLTADFTAQVWLHRADAVAYPDPISIASVTVPSGSTPGFAVTITPGDPGWDAADGFYHGLGDWLSLDVLASDGHADYKGSITMVLKWEIAA